MLEQLIANHEPLLFAGILVGVGGTFFFAGFKKLRTLRRIENTPTCKIRSMPMGSVEVKGLAQTEEPLEAPFTGKASAYYEIEIEEYRKRGKHSSWVTIHKYSSDAPFHLDDGTGRVLVIPHGAETHLPADFVQRTSLFSEAPLRLQTYLQTNGLERRFFNRGRSLRFTERHIEVGQPAYVHGVAQERAGLARWREQMERVTEKLREIKASPEAMQSLDVDGDGRVSDDEWQSAHSEAVAEVREEGVEDRVVIGAGSSGELFLLSDRSEKALVSRLRLESAGCVLGGGVAFIGGVVVLVNTLREAGPLG